MAIEWNDLMCLESNLDEPHGRQVHERLDGPDDAVADEQLHVRATTGC